MKYKTLCDKSQAEPQEVVALTAGSGSFNRRNGSMLTVGTESFGSMCAPVKMAYQKERYYIR